MNAYELSKLTLEEVKEVASEVAQEVYADFSEDTHTWDSREASRRAKQAYNDTLTLWRESKRIFHNR